MSVRVVARLRPLLKTEHDKDIIVSTTEAAAQDSENQSTLVRIPNPKNEAESFSFQFNSVYDQNATQSQLFDQEVAPTVKHLFKGLDVTIFAYGVTGTGKTHTMRGGKSLADRGMIPRLLSSIYRRARKIEKDSEDDAKVDVVMSYYEIYNDRVYDLFEPAEKRTPAGLPIRDNGGKTVVVGLTERPCTTLKDFERLYDEANVNRSTSATKLNAHSSRSHAILCVKVTQMNGVETRISTASAIDLAGSEDNRRTDNNKDRLVESASINKSLFVLAQCVEAISKKQNRIPYRESKMTRILSLGQNDGITVMVLNLAPVRSYHLDTLSSLNFANRTKKIEVNEVENQPFFRDVSTKGKLEGTSSLASITATAAINRQPLRPKLLSQDSHLKDVKPSTAKPIKQFAVYSDKSSNSNTTKASHTANTSVTRSSATGLSSTALTSLKSPKRTSSEAMPSFGRPAKALKSNTSIPNLSRSSGLSQEAIEALIERKVSEALAAGRAASTTHPDPNSSDPVSEEVQRRLDALEKRVEGQETERSEGLQYLLMAKQHQVRGEDASALKMYQLALPHFPENEKLVRKVAVLQGRIQARREEKRRLALIAAEEVVVGHKASMSVSAATPPRRRKIRAAGEDGDESYHDDQEGGDLAGEEEEDEFPVFRPRTKVRKPFAAKLTRPFSVPATIAPPPEQEELDSEDELASALTSQTPRTRQLLDIINTKDVSKIRLLKGVGAKKAEAIVNCLCDLDDDARVTSLGQLGKLKGVGVKTVETMRCGLGAF